MEVWVNADELEPRLDVRGVVLGNDLTYGDLTLVGSEEDVMGLLRRIADLFNATVDYRDPGPEGMLSVMADETLAEDEAAARAHYSTKAAMFGFDLQRWSS